MEFGWWKKDEDGKFQVRVRLHGGNIEWKRKQGHFQKWENYEPSEKADWERLVFEADKRVPRRLISKKQYEQIIAEKKRYWGDS